MYENLHYRSLVQDHFHHHRHRLRPIIRHGGQDHRHSFREIQNLSNQQLWHYRY